MYNNVFTKYILPAVKATNIHFMRMYFIHLIHIRRIEITEHAFNHRYFKADVTTFFSLFLRKILRELKILSSVQTSQNLLSSCFFVFQYTNSIYKHFTDILELLCVAIMIRIYVIFRTFLS